MAFHFVVVLVVFFLRVFIYLFIYFSEKIKLGISCESSALQTRHMNCRLMLSEIK